MFVHLLRPARLVRLIVASLGLLCATALLAPAPALAQSADCAAFPKTLQERQELIKQVNGLGKKANPKDACVLFTKLTTNGAGGLKWLETNKDWCQVPDQFAENFKADHARVSNIKGQACKAASQVAVMEKKAREQAQQGGGRSGLLGGEGLSGSYKMPQGAL
jgi:hypothetical protein